MNQLPWVQTGPSSGEVGEQLVHLLFLVATSSERAMKKVVRTSKI